MKVEVNKDEEGCLDYPLLMKSWNGQVVLMTGWERGIVIDGGITDHKIGKYIDQWDMEAFKPFEGKITISND